MKKSLEGYKKFIFTGIIIISLGITFSTTMSNNLGSIGTVLIAVGGLFFIIGMSNKKKSEKQQNTKS
jgi:multisubunit Na+/H+ antiporter MnhB subunit